VIIDKFPHVGEVVEIHLEARPSGCTSPSEQFFILPRWEGGGLVNGFEYAVDNVFGISTEEAVNMPPVKIMAGYAKQDVLNHIWEDYEKALQQLKESKNRER